MRDRIENLLREVHVLDSHRARVGHQLVFADTSTSDRSDKHPGLLMTPLQNALYVKYYCALPDVERAQQEEFVPFQEMNETESKGIEQQFLDQLRAANARAEEWLPGWNVHGMTPTGQSVLFCGETVHLAANVPDHVQGPTYRIHSDQAVGGAELRMPAEDISFATGFYFAYGATPADALLQHCLSRIYFNLSAAGAARWIGLITTTLDKHQIPFTLKCLLNPGYFRRSDAAVVYVARSNLALAWAVIQPRLAELANYLRSSVPMFAWQACAGVGIADDPGTGESFGQHRMRLVAQALETLSRVETDRSLSADPVVLPEKWSALERQFQQHGVSLAHPYVSSGFADFVPQLESL